MSTRATARFNVVIKLSVIYIVPHIADRPIATKPYIRHLRLRRAANELIRYPHLAVTAIAYGLGFKSASDFTRAFGRAYGMAPQDFRALAGKVVQTRR
ncbi:helix-turn-helix domain-containing protein [Paraburkholderia sp. BL6669N2]|uniref:helix-turn-helix domain-containing protein n=1 Tax=Paraburkholderia sp. BL6669N2 TaxID=1938807 RepID=UPI000E2393F4|nr:helix-turn-helix domain-containing protein [Paraburkholderia sp. BL6669N2]